jgi:hypothetical protein
MLLTMRLLRIAAAVLAATWIALSLNLAPATAEEPSTPPQQMDGSTDPKADEKVCKKVEMPGSRVSRHKVCKTRAEWGEEEKSEDSSAPKS